MKRRPLILAVVLTVAVVACIAPFWWEIWLAVAYEERVGPVIEVPNPQRGMASMPPRKTSIRYKCTRWIYQPGPELVLPQQICPSCKFESHHDCCAKSGPTLYIYLLPETPRGSAVDLNEFPCTCPLRKTDPDHP